MKKSKRLMFTIIIMIMNFILFIIGMYNNIDLVSLGTGLSLVNTPLFVYIFGETFRKSDVKKEI